MPGKNSLRLCRMDLDGAGASPERIAEAIHGQISGATGPVPVHDIARALDILEIRTRPLVSIEGCLLTQPERTDGKILVNANAPPRRQRFTVAHELGHFLISTHVSGDEEYFTCRGADMVAGPSTSIRDARRKQEAEANHFAINLLAPRTRCRRHLVGVPDLAAIDRLADEFDISREAAARRYVDLHRIPAAVVFARSGVVLYGSRHEGFPFVKLQPGDPLPRLPGQLGNEPISDHVEVDAEDWLAWNRGKGLVAQRLRQQGDRETVLIAFEVE